MAEISSGGKSKDETIASENTSGYLVTSTSFGDVPLDAHPGGSS